MPIRFLLERFEENRADEAILHGPSVTTYGALLEAIAAARSSLTRAGIRSGTVVSLETDFSAAAVAHLLALIDLGAIVVPLSSVLVAKREELIELGSVEQRVLIERTGALAVRATGRRADHPLYARLRSDSHSGLLLFTSGSSGAPKGVVHDWERLLRKYTARRHRIRTLMFLLFDHIGGLDSLLQAISNASAVVVSEDRTPDGVCAAIERHRVEVLPASPSFLALMLLSEAHRQHDLSSLRIITYGAEVMPPAMLSRLAAEFPGVRLLQKYGLTELGTLRSRSAANDSLLVSVGGEGYETRIVEGMLQIRAESSMLGYLNAPSPFTDDGWFVTGDVVEQHGDFLRIRGRASDLINVGGRKVYPAEVESVIYEVDNVAEAAVCGEPHPLVGQVVVARVRPARVESERDLETRIRAHCRARLDAHQVPVRVDVTSALLHTERDKSTRGRPGR